MSGGLERALQLRAQARYREALDALEDEADVEILLERSRLHEDLGEYLEAERAAANALATGDAVSRALARSAGVALAQRRPRDALPMAQEAVTLARESGDAGGLAEALIEEGSALLDLALLDDAESTFAEAQERANGVPSGIRRDRVVFAVHVGCGSVARGRGRYAEAEREFRIGIEVADRRFGEHALEKAAALNALGMVFKYSGRFDEAQAVYDEAHAILERAVGLEHPDLASLYHNLGGLEHARGRHEAAEPLARRSVEIRRATLGASHPAVAEDEAAYAAILYDLGRDAEAEPLLRRAIEEISGALGEIHPEVAVSVHNLGALRQRQGELEDAERLYRRALRIKEQLYGGDHVSVARTLNDLAVVTRRLGRPDAAEALYRRAISMLEATVEPSHPIREITVRNYHRLLEGEGRKPPGSSSGGCSQPDRKETSDGG